TLYPILMRLEKLHWLETRWEEVKRPGRPPRHPYRLSGTAREWVREETRAAQKRRFWKPAAAEHEACACPHKKIRYRRGLRDGRWDARCVIGPRRIARGGWRWRRR